MSEWSPLLLLFTTSCLSPMDGDARDRAPSITDDPSTPVSLVATWLGPAVQSAGDQSIEMRTPTSGTATLWWYGAFATWSVSANDDGRGDATLTLLCSNQPCLGDAPIIYDCVYTRSQLSCLGIAGGRNDSHHFAASGRTTPDIFNRSGA